MGIMCIIDGQRGRPAKPPWTTDSGPLPPSRVVVVVGGGPTRAEVLRKAVLARGAGAMAGKPVALSAWTGRYGDQAQTQQMKTIDVSLRQSAAESTKNLSAWAFGEMGNIPQNTA